MLSQAALPLVALLLLATGPGAGAGPGATVEFAFTDPAITESSGLVVDGSSGQDLFVTTNDSGDTARVFTVDPTTGDTVGVSTWGGEEDAVDVEALAPAGPGQVWVADIGDNDAERSSVTVARVRVGRGDLVGEPLERYELTYPSGARDAETLMVDPDGRLLVATKGLLGGEILRAEAPLDPEAPTPLTRIGVTLPIATDGAFFPDGRHLIVRGYGSAVVHAYPSLDEVGSFALPDQEQGEGIAVDDAGAVFLSSEGEGAEVLRVRLPRDVRRAMAPSEPSPESGPEPSPESSPESGPEPSREPSLSNEGEAGDLGVNSSGVPWTVLGLAVAGSMVLVGAGVRAARRRA